MTPVQKISLNLIPLWGKFGDFPVVLSEGKDRWGENKAEYKRVSNSPSRGLPSKPSPC